MVFGLADFFYAFVSAWSAADLFNSWLKQLFNVLYTTLPVVLYSIFDRQLPMEVTLQTPVLYPAFASKHACHAVLHDGKILNSWMFARSALEPHVCHILIFYEWWIN